MARGRGYGLGKRQRTASVSPGLLAEDSSLCEPGNNYPADQPSSEIGTASGLSCGLESSDCSRESHPFQPSSSIQSEQYCLACDEDGDSFEDAVVEEAAGCILFAHPASPSRVGNLQHQLCLADAREAIWNELDRQSAVRVAPDRPTGQRWASTDRPRVVAWLVEVVTHMRLARETLHAAVSLLDRFVAGTEALPPDTMLQLLALACVSVATKHEEVAQYRPDDWVVLAADGAGRPIYQATDLARMELLLLETLEWRIRLPTALTFLRHFQPALAPASAASAPAPSYSALSGRAYDGNKDGAEEARDQQHLQQEQPEEGAADGAAGEIVNRAHMLAELALLHDAFLGYPYSTLAAASLVLAEWTTKAAAAAPSADATVADGDDSSLDPATAAPPAAALSPAPAIRTVTALTAFVGADLNAFAPKLSAAVAELHVLYEQAVTPYAGTAGVPAGDRFAHLGLLAPVVRRYCA